jgi:glutamine amidotransferase
MKNVIIIDYGMGNLSSVAHGFKFLGYQAEISSRSKDIAKAEALVLPGVGCFAEAMKNLIELAIVDILQEKVLIKKTPFLGICLGMQLLAEDSVENGKHQGLNFIPGHVVRIPFAKEIRVPHVGWNTVRPLRRQPLFIRLPDRADFYFDHSYHFECDDKYISSVCDYGITITASLQYDNIFATQFHPEKSQVNGLKVLRGFLNYIEAVENNK